MDEHEPPASWDQQEEDNLWITRKFAGLNIDAIEFLPSFGSKSTNIPTPPIINTHCYLTYQWKSKSKSSEIKWSTTNGTRFSN